MLVPPPALPSPPESTQRTVVTPGLPSAKANLDPDLAKKVADARAKVESMAKRRALAAGNYAAVVANPYLVRDVNLRSEGRLVLMSIVISRIHRSREHLPRARVR